MYTTAKFVTIVGFRLMKLGPSQNVNVEFDDGTEIVLSEHFFKHHGFKLRDKVVLTITMDNDQDSSFPRETEGKLK